MRLKDILSDAIQQNLSKTGFWDELTEQQQKELDAVIEESYNEKNLISNEEVIDLLPFKKHKK